MRLPRMLGLPVLAIAVLALAGCGSAKSSSSSTAPAGATGSSAGGGSSSATTAASAGGSTSSSSPGALSADARSAATGDIPDNQVFLVFHNRKAGYSIKYPEGWTQRGSAGDVTFKDKNNLVHIVVSPGAAPTAAGVAAALQKLRASDPTLTFTAPKSIQIGSHPGVKAVYTTKSAPNPVTGKRVLLIVDRYVLAMHGTRAVVDLGTPKGVDNVDAYRLMIESFTWK